MSILRNALRPLKKTELVWRYLSNLRPTVSFALRPSERLTSLERCLAALLDRDGVAVTSIDALVDATAVNEFDKSIAGLLENKTEEIVEHKLNAGYKDVIGSKTFNLELLGSELKFNADDVYARLALNESILKIANAYFGMFAKLRYYNVWQTFASSGPARESQLWHFDREDRYILKIFLYLDDVDEGAGPFTYAPGTHKKGKYRDLQPEFFLEGGVKRTTDEQMRAMFPEKLWIKGTGKKGTLIFADTRGFHKGGEARTKDRLMYTCMFTSQASESEDLIKIPEDLDRRLFNSIQLRALGIW